MIRRGLARVTVGGVVALGSLAPVAAQELGSVLREQEVAWSTGGFGGVLSDVDHFGHALAALGDLDGDGVGDLAVGAPDDDDGGTGRGALWILFLEPAGTVRAQVKISATEGGFAGSLRNGDRFGSALAALGDLDGDGRVELAVGAELDDDGGPNRGALWILSLETSGQVWAARKISQTSGGFGGSLGDRGEFGCALAALGDLDGDGRSELAVGARAEASRGAVWVLFLDASGGVREQARIGQASGAFAGVLDVDDQFGSALAALADIDGDGRGELVVGAAQDDDGGANSGAAWVLFLQADASVRAHAKLSRSSGLPFASQDRFGVSLAALGDVDGDGTDDLAVGASLDDDGGLNSGAVWVLLLGPDGGLKDYQTISATAGGLALPPVAGDLFGVGLAALGDLDGDRKLDLAVGAEGADTGGRERGACRVLFLQTVEAVTLTVRNGLGLNPLILSATRAPVVGHPWDTDVDCTGFQRGLALLFVASQPLDGPVLGRLGQLLVDWRVTPYAFVAARHLGTPTRLSVAVPASPALAGLTFSAQAFVTGRSVARLTNALDGVVQAR